MFGSKEEPPSDMIPNAIHTHELKTYRMRRDESADPQLNMELMHRGK